MPPRIRNPITLFSDFVDSVWDRNNGIVKTGEGGESGSAAENIGSTTPTNSILDTLDGDSGGAAALLLDPAAQSGGTASVAYDLNTLMRWHLKLLQTVGQINYQANNWVPGRSDIGSAQWTGDSTGGFWEIPNEELWQPIAINVALTTSATAGTRRMQVAVQNQTGTTTYDRTIFGVTQPISTTYNYNLGIGKSESPAPVGASNVLMMPLTPLVISPTDRLRIVVLSIQTGDTLAGTVSYLKRKNTAFI